MSLKAFVKRILSDPDIDAEVKGHVQALMASHLATGMELKKQGLLQEAIEEFRMEENRPIHSSIDEEIVQSAYVYIGSIYKELNDIDNAKAAFIKALELWRLYGYGWVPHYELAEILAEQGNIDEAIELCKERLSYDPEDSGIKLLLDKLLIMKQGK